MEKYSYGDWTGIDFFLKGEGWKIGWYLELEIKEFRRADGIKWVRELDGDLRLHLICDSEIKNRILRIRKEFKENELERGR